MQLANLQILIDNICDILLRNPHDINKHTSWNQTNITRIAQKRIDTHNSFRITNEVGSSGYLIARDLQILNP